jgi:hypothetical protein
MQAALDPTARTLTSNIVGSCAKLPDELHAVDTTISTIDGCLNCCLAGRLLQLETNPKEVCTQERWTSNPAVFDYLKCKDYCVWQGGQGTTDLSICLRFLFWKVCWDWNLGADFTKPPCE